MKALIQRVNEASVTVEQQEIARIEKGLLVFLGVDQQDTEQDALKLLDKVVRYRVFADADGKMNRSLLDVQQEMLVVSQFTLVAETTKGLRPSFSKAAPPELGRALYECFASAATALGISVAKGRFGADMKVGLVNDGPVTFMLEM